MKKLLLVPILSLAVLIGCTTSQQSTAFKSIATVEATVNVANDGYQQLVIVGQLPTNDVPKIAHLYNAFQASELIALDAVQFNTNALAPSALIIEGQDFVNVVTAIKSNLH